MFGSVGGDGNDSIDINAGFLNDGSGLDDNPSMHVSFDSPMLCFEVDHPGIVQIDLFSGNELIHSALFINAGLGFFSGLVSTELFDNVLISDPLLPDAFIDDLHFGVPSPGVIAFLALGGLRARRRRSVSPSRIDQITA